MEESTWAPLSNMVSSIPSKETSVVKVTIVETGAVVSPLLEGVRVGERLGVAVGWRVGELLMVGDRVLEGWNVGR